MRSHLILTSAILLAAVTLSADDAVFPYGAVYFRKSNPPREDWERDYRVAAEDGMNIFRHWFMWGSIERAPGVYDWADYDRQMDLAAENGITPPPAKPVPVVRLLQTHIADQSVR